MAFSANVSSEGTGFKMYTGVGSFFVRGINFNKEEMSEFFGKEVTNDPVFVDDVEVNGKTVKRVNIAVYLELEPNKYKDNEGKFINFKTTLYLSLVRTPVVGSTSGKIQVIDKYGRTAWGTPDVVENGKQIMYSNGPANISTQYRKIYNGEDTLISFLIAYLNVPSTVKNVNGTWVTKDENELKDCEASIPYMEDLFKGKFKDLEADFSIQPENKVKLLVGIKTTDDGKQRQVIFNRMFLKNGNNNYSKLATEVDNFMANTSQNVVYEVEDLHEYKVQATNFSTPTEESDPFSNSDSSELPFEF